MKNIFLLVIVSFILVACATSYKPVSPITGNGYSEILLQDNIYDVSFKGSEETSIKRAKDFALLRAAEVCLENGYKTFSIVSSENNSKSETGVVFVSSYSYAVSETKPHVSLVIKCSKEEDLFFKATDIKSNLRKKYKLK